MPAEGEKDDNSLFSVWKNYEWKSPGAHSRNLAGDLERGGYTTSPGRYARI